MGIVKAPFGRWDVGEAPPGGVGIPWVADTWATHFESYYIGVRRVHDPQFCGTLWAGVFDLRWQFVALHRYMMHLPSARAWHIWAPDDACHKAWEVAHAADHTEIAKHRLSWRGTAEWYAGELLAHPDLMETRFEKSPLWEFLPLEAWEPILTEVAAGRWSVTPEERVAGLRWGITRMGIQYPQTINGTDVEDVLDACNRALLVARQVGGREYAELPDAWAETDTPEVAGDVGERQVGWLQEVRKVLVSKHYRGWL